MNDYIELKDEEAQLIEQNKNVKKLIIPIAILGEEWAGKSFVYNKVLEIENR